MVYSRQIGTETGSQCPTDQRHKSLKKTKKKSQTEHKTSPELTDDNTAYNRDGEAIHGQSQRYEKMF